MSKKLVGFFGFWRGLYFCFSLFLLLVSIKCDAQGEGNRLRQRPQDERRSLPEQPLLPPHPESLDLPELPTVPTDESLASKLIIQVKRIELIGNKRFSKQQLAEVIDAYEGRNVTARELQELRKKLTLFYVQHGYINSGAIIPDQHVTDGVIRLKIVEGQLSGIKISGNDGLNESYLRKRLRLGSEDILDFNALGERVQLLHQNRLIDRINASLVPGLRAGEGILRVQVKERRPYELGVSFNNWRSPSVGSLQGEIYGAHYNVSGNGDRFSARYARTGGMNNGSATYSFPLTAHDTRVSFFYDRSDADVIEEQFKPLDITSETEGYGIRLSHPFYHTPQATAEASLSFERRRSESQSHGEPFPAGVGTDNGRSKVTVLRFTQEWVNRSASQVIAARSTFSIGLDALDATINDGSGNEVPDGRFFAWMGQFQWVTRLWGTDNQLVLRSYLQLAADPLLPLEKFGLGGASTVRGYRENTFVRDNAWVNSVEFRIPVFRLPIPGISRGENDGILQVATFYDFGWAENNRFTDPNLVNVQQPSVVRTLSSVGLGLRWDPHEKIHSEVYWGYALRNIDEGGEYDLQDSGVHFLVNLQVF